MIQKPDQYQVLRDHLSGRKRLNLTSRHRITSEWPALPIDSDDLAAAGAAANHKISISVRVNSSDLKIVRKYADSHNIKYQSFIREILHRVAMKMEKP